MITVTECIVHDHNIWLVLVALAICVAGSWVTARLFSRTISARGLQYVCWHFLTALSAGAAVWCTHFVAMLGYHAGAPVSFDPVITIASLLIEIIGSTAGFLVAAGRFSRFAPALGGAIVGFCIALMHYTGMMAYRVDGVVSWDMSYVIASVILSVVLAMAALHIAMGPWRQAQNLMAAFFALAVVTLHFTGMAALHVVPSRIGAGPPDTVGQEALALAVAGMALLIAATGLVSYLIEDRTRAESVERLRRMALNDLLTGLPNRASLGERLDHEVALAGERQSRFALIGIDLNRFKEINDLRGHGAGDEVLRILGRRLRTLLREEDGEFVARTGGDEFVAIHRVRDDQGLADFLARLEAAAARPIHVEDFEFAPGASFGVALFPDNARDKELLISQADLAMYRAKADLTRNVCFYQPGMDDATKARRCLAADLRHALARNELSLHYQVQTAVPTGDVTGYEALLRWNHPVHGSIPPTEFIPVAEENGLILPIGEWVLWAACTDAADWEPPHRVAVNLSPVQFAHADLPRLIQDVLSATGLPPSQLELELTETAIFADRERSLDILHRIKALGVNIALDDFGTGYSSLDTLRSFPFDKIKIDKSFISDAMADAQAIAIIRAVLALGKSLNIPVLAEGIESQAQLSLLHHEECDEAQGFLLGRPMQLEQILASGQLALREDKPRPCPPLASWEEGSPLPAS